MIIKKKKIIFIAVSVSFVSILTVIFFVLYYNVIYVYIEHTYSEQPLQNPTFIRVVLDDGVIFSGELRPMQIMPPIAYNDRVILGGKHTIEFHDETKDIKEKRTFSGSGTRTILIRTQEDFLEKRHIIIDSERIPIK